MISVDLDQLSKLLDMPLHCITIYKRVKCTAYKPFCRNWENCDRFFAKKSITVLQGASSHSSDTLAE